MTEQRPLHRATWYLVGILIAALLMATLASIGNNTVGKAAVGDETRKVTVTGMSELQIKPDEATVHLGVQTQGDTADAASQANHTTMAQVIAALKKSGVSEQDIQTSGFSLYPIQDFEVFPTPEGIKSNREPAIRGYRADNTVRFTTKDLEGLGALIDQAVTSGANTIHGIRFGLSDPQSFEKQAFDQAIKHARSKADMLVRFAGASLGEVLTIEEFGSQPTAVYAEAAMAQDLAGAKRIAAPIEPGQVTYSLQVRVSYAIR